MQLNRKAPKGDQMRKEAGAWLKSLRAAVGLSQIELAQRLGLRYYTFVSQVESGVGRVLALEQPPADFARRLLTYYDPELHRLLFEVKS